MTATKRSLFEALRVVGPMLAALTFAGVANVAHAQGTMDFSGAQTLMGTFNARFAYVSVSRASHEEQIFTNDAGTLAENLSRDVSKASAIDLREAPPSSLNIGLEGDGSVSKNKATTNLELAL